MELVSFVSLNITFSKFISVDQVSFKNHSHEWFLSYGARFICFVKYHFSFRFVSFRFVSFRFVSFRFVSFRFVSFRFDE